MDYRDQLTADEEAELGRRVRAWKDHGIDPEGGLAARNELVERNMRLATWAINGMACVRACDRDEFTPAAYSGLIRAATKFDPARGRFSTYAARWIRQAVRRAVQCERVIHVPAHVWDKASKYRHLIGEEPTRAFTGAEDYVLDTPTDDEGGRDAAELVELLLDEVRLPPKEREILARFYGLEGPPETLEVIGRSHGISREAVRQRREKALKILAVAARGRLRAAFEAGCYLTAV